MQIFHPPVAANSCLSKDFSGNCQHDHDLLVRCVYTVIALTLPILKGLDDG
jgi:hypothetical protein